MTSRLTLALICLALAGLFGLLSCDIESGKTEPGLREAMQERMQDVVRLREAWDRGEPMDNAGITRFAGLPHSEFVDDVSQYQAWFETFDDMYEAIFVAENPVNQFNLVIRNCAACHQNVCPGPLRSIVRLEIPDSGTYGTSGQAGDPGLNSKPGDHPAPGSP